MTTILSRGAHLRLLVLAVLVAAVLALTTAPVAAGGGGKVYGGPHNVPGGIARNITWE